MGMIFNRAPRRGRVSVCTGMLAGAALGLVLVHSRYGIECSGDNHMNESSLVVDHVSLVTDKPFEDAARDFEQQLGRLDQKVASSLTSMANTEEAKRKIDAMAGPSGLMLFGTTDHGSLLHLAGQKRKAVQYVVGNPLVALQMTQHDIRASLYAPLRVLIYENEAGKTCVEYDKPSSLFSQFGNAEVTAVARMLDLKLEALAAAVR